MRLFYYLLALLGGAALSLEGAIGSALGETIGELESTFYIFFMGSIILGLITLFFGKGNLMKTAGIPRWQLLGGILGTTYLTLIFIAVPYIGVGTAMFSVIIGQMIMSMTIEHFGWLGSKQVKMTRNRILSIICMFIALILIF